MKVFKLENFSIFYPSFTIIMMELSPKIIEKTWTTTGFGPIPAMLSERFPTEVRNSACGFVYNGGLIIGSWAPLIAVNLLSNAGNLIPFLLAANIIIGSVVILVGAKINPETRDVDLE